MVEEEELKQFIEEQMKKEGGVTAIHIALKFNLKMEEAEKVLKKFQESHSDRYKCVIEPREKLVEWKGFKTLEEFGAFVTEKIGEEGIYQYDLVNAIHDKYPHSGSKEKMRLQIKKFVAKHNEEFEIVPKKVIGKRFPYVQRR